MPVPNQDPESQHVGNGVTTAFAYDFLLLNAADLEVYVAGVLKTLNVDYTVAGLNNQSGGSVTFGAAPANGAIVLLLRSMEVARDTEYQYAGDFQAPTVNRDYDRIWMVLQDLTSRFFSAIRFPRGENALNSILPKASLRAKKALIFDDLGRVAVSTDNFNEQATNAAASALEAKQARDEAEAIAANFSDQADARLDAIEAEGKAVINGMGYLPPDAYTAGLLMNSPRQTVTYAGNTYAPNATDLPFTTSGVFETAKFRLIQGITGSDLAAPSGLPAYGFTGPQVQSILDKALPKDTHQGIRDDTSRALAYRVLTRGIFGEWVIDPSDTTSADDNATVLVRGDDGMRVKRLFTGAANVKWFGAKGDGVTDDYAAMQACLDAYDRILIPEGNYLMSAGLHASRVVEIEADKNSVLIAAAGFTGMAITKAGAAFTLKALISIFSGTDIGQQTNPRLGEAGRNVKIGPAQLNCAGNADYGLLVNSCPGVQMYCHAFDAVKYGIWAGPNCWGSASWHPRILRCVEGGIYFGEACNGAAVYGPEIWGQTIKTAVGVYLEGSPAGSIGAIGNVKITGGYIEDCVNGVLLKNAGSLTLLAVDIESIDQHCVFADCSSGGTYGQINAIGCQLASLGAAFFNRNAYIYAHGTGITDGLDLNPYHSDTPYSLFKIDATLQYQSDGAPAEFPDLASTQTVIASYETQDAVVAMNKRLTDSVAEFSRSWSVFNKASNDQPLEVSTGLEMRNSRFGGVTNDYRGSIYVFAQVTTSDPSPRAKKAAGLLLDFTGDAGLETASFHPEEDNDVSLGTQANRWKHIYGTQYHAPGPGGVDAPGATGTFTTADGKTVTVRFGIVTGIV